MTFIRYSVFRVDVVLHRYVSEVSGGSSPALGEDPSQRAVVQSFLQNYDKVSVCAVYRCVDVYADRC